MLGCTVYTVAVNDLHRLGLRRHWIYEALVATTTPHGPHASPTGLWTDDGRRLRMDLYPSSSTLTALLATGECSADFPADAHELFVALHEPETLAFSPARTLGAPLVAGASAALELKVTDTSPHGDVTRVTAAVAAVHESGPLHLINRAEGLLLESLVLSTRVEILGARAVTDALGEHLRVVNKVAPGSKWADDLETLLRQVSGRS